MKRILIISAILMMACDKPDLQTIQENCYCSPDIKQESDICKQVCGVIQNL